eukprot:scaffold66792_cov57-Phaeocystis_antarctica.AAC.2
MGARTQCRRSAAVTSRRKKRSRSRQHRTPSRAPSASARRAARPRRRRRAARPAHARLGGQTVRGSATLGGHRGSSLASKRGRPSRAERTALGKR